MDVAIVVALLAGIFGTVATVLGALITRSADRDLRSDISKDLEILRGLDPNSLVSGELQAQIEQRVEGLILRENERQVWRAHRSGVAKSGLLTAVGATIYFLTHDFSWNDAGRELRQSFHDDPVAYWLGAGAIVLGPIMLMIDFWKYRNALGYSYWAQKRKFDGP